MKTIVDFECVQPAKRLCGGAWGCDVIWSDGSRQFTIFYPPEGSDWHKAVEHLEGLGWLGRNPRAERDAAARASITAARSAYASPEVRTESFVLNVQMDDRTQALTVIFSTYPGSEYVLVRDMVGFNDPDLTEIFRSAAKEHPLCATILDLVGGMFVDLRSPCCKPSDRLYRDGTR